MTRGNADRAELRKTPAGDTPIACLLSAADLGNREGEWRALLDTALVRGDRLPSGVRITVQRHASEELRRLIDLERSCCGWMRFDFEAPETVAITASGEGVDVLVAMFLDRDVAALTQPETT